MLALTPLITSSILAGLLLLDPIGACVDVDHPWVQPDPPPACVYVEP